MQYQEYDLGYVECGKKVEVKLSNSAIIRIMDYRNYQEYKSGNDHKFLGGYVSGKTHISIIPHNEQWYVVVDLGGYSGQISSDVRILPDGC